MTTVARAVERTKDLLRDRARFPWKTAAWLARQLRQQGIRVSSHELEAALLRTAERDGRQVRYSIYPGRHALDLIWGHVDHVGETGNLPPSHARTGPGARRAARRDHPLRHRRGRAVVLPVAQLS